MVVAFVGCWGWPSVNSDTGATAVVTVARVEVTAGAVVTAAVEAGVVITAVVVVTAATVEAVEVIVKVVAAGVLMVRVTPADKQRFTAN